MIPGNDLPIVRRAYARQMLALAGVESNPALEDAFAHVERERFLGVPPWTICHNLVGYRTLRVSDPMVVYQDALFSLDAKRGVNNGSPALHARWLDALAPRLGENAVHIGAGSGYYTAILAHLVGETGHVTAVEYDVKLAAEARDNLAHLFNVTVIHADGTKLPDAPCDAIYVNFGVERPAEPWIEQLKPAGRLVVPLGVPRQPVSDDAFISIAGGGFCITRDAEGFKAAYLGPCYFVGAEGGFAATKQDRAVLKAAFKAGGAEQVRRLIWHAASSGETWFTGTGWGLEF
jgi:protein-L-isoaspartate(D-aspartate) O-methyltransferase